MTRSARVLQYWLICTYKPTFTSAVIRLIYQGLPTYLVSSSSNYYWTWDIVLTRFSDIDLCWPQMTFDLHENNRGHLLTTHTHCTHTRHSHRIYSFSLRQGIKKCKCGLIPHELWLLAICNEQWQSHSLFFITLKQKNNCPLAISIKYLGFSFPTFPRLQRTG